MTSKVVASLDTLRDPALPVAAKRAVLRRIQGTFPSYSILLLANTEGRIVATSNGLIEGADISRRDYFQAGLRASFAGDVHDAVLLAKLLPRDTTEPLRLVDFSAPVKNEDGQVLVGVVASHLDWTWSREVARSFERSLKGHRAGAEIFVLAHNGTVLMGPPAHLNRKLPRDTLSGSRVIRDDSESRIGPWPDVPGDHVFATHRTTGHLDYPGLGWTIVARHDADLALASVTELSRRVLLSGLGVAALAALLAWILAGRIARPLQGVALAAEALGRNDPLPPSKSPMVREGRAIAQAFHAAASELQRREEARRLLIDELNHRVKNTLATVQSIAAQSLRGLGDAAALGRVRLEARLFALSAAHNVLTRESWSGADLKTVTTEVLRPYDLPGACRFQLDGEPVRLSPNLSLAVSMILHELCTNAAKYGALSVPYGCVSLSWRLHQDGAARHLRLLWREENGPPVEPREHRGFGSLLIDRGLSAELGVTAFLRFECSGVVCEINAQLDPA